MPLPMPDDKDIWKLTDELFKQFKDRDTKWMERRDVRYRRMAAELKRLPLNPEVSDSALLVFQTELPNQEAHKRVKRLTANRARFEVVIFEPDAKARALGQELEDGAKALYRWLNRGRISFDQKLTQHQIGDGLGIGKEDFLPDHGQSLEFYDPDLLTGDDEEEVDDQTRGRNKARASFRSALTDIDEGASDREKKAYAKVTEAALRSELPPIRFSSVDPLACAWWEDGDGIAIIAERGRKSLNPLLVAFATKGLSYDKVSNRLVVLKDEAGDAVAAETIPPSEVRSDLANLVDYTEIRTREEIIILIEHPKLKDRDRKRSGSDRGVMFRYPNPFGPYTTGYVLVPGDVTTETNEADKYQPPILGTINAAYSLNVIATARLSAGLAAALAPPYIEVPADSDVPIEDEDKTPEVDTNRSIPSIRGKIKRVEAPNVDLERADVQVANEMASYEFQDALVGDAKSEDSGHKLALQVAQADIQMVPYQNSRADAIAELMKGVIYAVRKHGLPIYIPTLPESAGRREGGDKESYPAAKITPEMADLPFELVVTLGAETAISKYAKWQALQDREERGSIGFETLIDQSDVEDPQEEIARIFEGKAIKSLMETLLPEVASQLVQRLQAKIAKALQPPVSAAPPVGVNMPFGAQPISGEAGGGGVGPGGSGIENMIRLPGIGMPPAGPTSNSLGPNIVAGGGEAPVSSG